MNTLTLRTRRDPFTDVDQLVRQAFRATGAFAAQAGYTPAAEVTRSGDDAVIRLELPGVDVANDVDIEVTKGRLVVSGTKHEANRSDDDERTVREFRYGSFQRAFRLPAETKAEAVSATYADGVLTVTVAGAHAKPEPHKVAITKVAPVREDAAEPQAEEQVEADQA